MIVKWTILLIYWNDESANVGSRLPRAEDLLFQFLDNTGFGIVPYLDNRDLGQGTHLSSYRPPVLPHRSVVGNVWWTWRRPDWLWMQTTNSTTLDSSPNPIGYWLQSGSTSFRCTYPRRLRVNPQSNDAIASVEGNPARPRTTAETCWKHVERRICEIGQSS